MDTIGSIGYGATQLARLRNYVLLPWQSVASSPGSLQETLLPLDREDPASDRSVAVPRGYLAIYAGHNLRRFVIPMSYLGRPEFRDLLARAEEEYGFEQEAGLTLPCEAEELEELLEVMERTREKPRTARWSGNVGFRRCSSLIGTLAAVPSSLPPPVTERGFYSGSRTRIECNS